MKNENEKSIWDEYIGQMVLVRAEGAGVYYGELVSVEGTAAKVKNVRNIWHWRGANCLSDIAENGVDGDKIGRVVSSCVFAKVIQIFPMTDKAVARLNAVKPWTRE